MIENVSIDTAIEAARAHLSEAQSTFNFCNDPNEPSPPEWFEWRVHDEMEAAFLQLLVLCESLDLERTYQDLKAEYSKAAGSQGAFGEACSDSDGYPHLVWQPVVEKYISCLEANFGLSGSRKVCKDLEAVLRATQYSIVDPRCFENPPEREWDVHVRVEAVLRCVLPDLKHKPVITKQIKNFEPDTGLPSLRTLIEYKYVGSDEQSRKVADEILADTRGYVSKEWDYFIFYLYETHRFRQESEWNQLLKDCGTARNASAIVICGEPRAKRKSATNKQSQKPKGRARKARTSSKKVR